VKLVFYADESGTHDPTGNAPGSKVANVAGMVAPYDEWAAFCNRWQAALELIGNSGEESESVERRHDFD
jgi:hypothetical protein